MAQSEAVATRPPTAAVTTQGETPTESRTPADLARSKLIFARFEELTVEGLPAVEQEPIAADLANVRTPFSLSEAMRERLARTDS